MEITGKFLVAIIFSITFWVLSFGSEAVLKKITSTPCEFPAIYNFGDSNSDTGGISAAFYPMASPSGQTFFHHPAGRGSDGRLMIDFIAEKLQLPYLSPYLDSIGSNFRHGANFATGGSTIRRQNESTFLNGVSPFSLDIQIGQFNQFKDRTSRLYNTGNNSLDSMRLPKPEEFSKAIYTFDIGQNDLAAGFRAMSNQQFQLEIPDIINQLSTAIKNLYEKGGRTFWIHNTGPIGCLPVTLHYVHVPVGPGILDPSGCVKAQNDMAVEFNRQLKQKVIQLREQLPLIALTYVDVFAAKLELITNAKKQGFKEKENICCGYHEDNNHVWCGNTATINGTRVYAGSCEDPSLYISWDGVHYTEAANHWTANHLINGSYSDPNFPITLACHRN